MKIIMVEDRDLSRIIKIERGEGIEAHIAEGDFSLTINPVEEEKLGSQVAQLLYTLDVHKKLLAYESQDDSQPREFKVKFTDPQHIITVPAGDKALSLYAPQFAKAYEYFCQDQKKPKLGHILHEQYIKFIIESFRRTLQ